MRYILDDNGYIEEIIFGGMIDCNNKSCTEYIGDIPTGYTSLIEWADNANIRAYTIIDNNLVYDSAKDIELKEKWAIEKANNTPEVLGNKVTSIDSTNTDKQYPSAKAVYNAIPEIVDNLTDTSKDKVLTANQGKILNDKINYTEELTSEGSYITRRQVGTDEEVWVKFSGVSVTIPQGWTGYKVGTLPEGHRPKKTIEKTTVGRLASDINTNVLLMIAYKKSGDITLINLGSAVDIQYLGDYEKFSLL